MTQPTPLTIFLVRAGGPEESTDLRAFSSRELAEAYLELCFAECPWMREETIRRSGLAWLGIAQMSLDWPIALDEEGRRSLHYHLDIEDPAANAKFAARMKELDKGEEEAP